jgi:hypothetical protein
MGFSLFFTSVALRMKRLELLNEGFVSFPAWRENKVKILAYGLHLTVSCVDITCN